MAQVLQENGIRFPSLQEDGDEVVIQAGCVRAFEEASSQSAHLESGDIQAACDNACDAESFRSPVADCPAVAPSDAGQVRSEGMVTTEEDLKEQIPFSGMRRVIVILAVAAIVAMVAYCLINR
ncbi:MAG: hypothetical protein ACI4B9_02295 [Eggerthellaceae bacterium]